MDFAQVRGQLADAVASQDPVRIAEFASRQIFRLFCGDYAGLLRAVQLLPPEVLQQYPALCLVQPSAGVVARSTRPVDLSAFDSYRGVPGEEQAIAVALKMIAARAGGDIVTAVSYAKHLAELVRLGRGGHSGDPTGPLWFLHEQMGSTLLCAGSTSSALREFATARQYGETLDSIDARRTTEGRAAVALAVRGSIEDAERSLRAAVGYPPLSDAFHRNALSTERTAAALIAVDRMNAEAAQRVSELDEVDVYDVIWPFIFLARVRYLLAIHRAEDALETARTTEAAHVVQPGTFAADVLAAHRVSAHLALGDVGTAASVVESQARPGPATQFSRLRMHIHSSDFAEASRVHRALSSSSWLAPAHRAELHLLKAFIEILQLGEVSPAVATRIATIAETGHFRRLFTSVPAEVVERVREQLDDSRIGSFDAGLAGLGFLPRFQPRPQLTRAEGRVLGALQTATTTAEIAELLGVSVNTVKTQLRRLYRKLGVSSRVEAIAAGERHDLTTWLPDDTAPTP